MKTSNHPAVLAFRQQIERTRQGLQKLDAANDALRDSVPPGPTKRKNGKRDTEPPLQVELLAEDV